MAWDRYDKNDVRPAFPFGHGLSYGGTFNYGDLAVKDRTVSFTVGRESSVAGCETAQVYFGYPEAATNPVSIVNIGLLGGRIVKFSLLIACVREKSGCAQESASLLRKSVH